MLLEPVGISAKGRPTRGADQAAPVGAGQATAEAEAPTCVEPDAAQQPGPISRAPVDWPEDLRAALAEAAEALLDAFTADGASIGVVHHDAIEYVACSGVVSHWRTRRIPIESSFTGMTVIAGAARVFQRTDAAPVSRARAAQGGFESGMIAPVMREGRAVGTVGVVSIDERDYTATDLARLETQGRALAETMARLADGSTSSIGGGQAAHGVTDRAPTMLAVLQRPLSGVGEALSYVRRELAHKSDLAYWPRLDQALAEASVQVEHIRGMLGELEHLFDRAIDAHPPQDSDHDNGDGGRPHRGRGIDRGRVLQLIAQGEPLKRVLSQLAQDIERDQPGALLSAWLVNSGRLWFTAGPELPRGFVAAIDGTEVGAASSPIARTTQTRAPVIISDLDQCEVPSHEAAAAAEAGISACWCCPILLANGEVGGVLALHQTSARVATPERISLLEEAASLAGIALGQHRADRQLRFQRFHDPVTGLPNRILMRQRLEQALAAAVTLNQPAALLLIDLDNFKYVNETLGHSAGDRLLQMVAERLRTCVRGSDTPARLGGDEFLLILPLATAQDAAKLCKKLLKALAPAFVIDNREIYVTPSIGISLFPSDGKDVETLLRAADAAMYGAKASGKNTYRFYSPAMKTNAAVRLVLETDLRRAIHDGQFLLHYQPKVCLRTEEVVGFEALVRWQHPKFGLLGPEHFIPLAEQSGLIMEVGRWVLEEACRQTRSWHDEGYDGLHVAVNLSGRQFRHQNLADTVGAVIAASGLPPHCLELEITENMLMQHIDEVVSQMWALKELGGLRLSIDDFGTGYSSLSYLKTFPVDSLKIDRSFVSDIGRSLDGGTDDHAIIKTIVTLGHSLDLTVVAEGAETIAQLDLLRELDCDQVQGYVYSTPLPADEFAKLLDPAELRRRRLE